MPSPEQVIETLKEILHYLEYVPIAFVLAVGIIVAARHIKEFAADYWERLRDKEHHYRVRTTIVKDLMTENSTETAKLRRLRVSKSTDTLILDPWPTIVDVNRVERPASLAQFYSVPGRLGLQDKPSEDGIETKFVVYLSGDEKFRAHQTYSTLLVYNLEEKLDAILAPPEFIADQPVGEECFTYEVHFPPDRRFVRSKNLDDPKRKDKPRIRVFHDVIDEKHELRYESYTRQNKNWLAWKWTRFINRYRTRYHVMGGRTNFRDRLGEHDWFRITILKPPQDEDIHICWCMEGDPVTSWSWCSHSADEHKGHE